MSMRIMSAVAMAALASLGSLSIELDGERHFTAARVSFPRSPRRSRVARQRIGRSKKTHMLKGIRP